MNQTHAKPNRCPNRRSLAAVPVPFSYCLHSCITFPAAGQTPPDSKRLSISCRDAGTVSTYDNGNLVDAGFVK